MRPKHQRLRLVLLSILVMAVAATLLLRNFQDSLVFFYTPSQWQQKKMASAKGQEIRIGGLVKTGSVKNIAQGIEFTITDMTSDMQVRYQGLLPTLFREGQGVVAQGQVEVNGTLIATTILAKHDENYMPREVVEQLKASGQWQEYGTKP